MRAKSSRRNDFYVVQMTHNLSKSLKVTKRGYKQRKTAYAKARAYQEKDKRHYYTVHEAATPREALRHQPKGTFMHGRKENPGRGRAFYFLGSATSKLAAKRIEAKHPGSFIHEKDGRFYILKPKKIRSNPHNAVPIYGRVLRIEAEKTWAHEYGGKASKPSQKYYHDFTTKNVMMYGLPDGSILIKAKGR